MSKDDLKRIRQEEMQLERRLAKLRKRRERLEVSSRSRREAARPLRDLVLDLLDDAKTPLNSLLLASVCRPLFGREIPATRFGTLSNDEEKSFVSSRVRPVYLCHCLMHDSGQAMKRFWARSDWPLHERIIGPITGRVLFLRGAIWTIQHAMQPSDAQDPNKLYYVAADQARDAGLQVRRGDFPFDDWLEALASMLARHQPEDEGVRRDAAVRIQDRLTDHELLFGARSSLVSLPGSSSRWRSAHE
jgi:hypothetical protein